MEGIRIRLAFISAKTGAGKQEIILTGLYTVEQIIGAVKLAAAQFVPEALNHRLFPNL